MTGYARPGVERNNSPAETKQIEDSHIFIKTTIGWWIYGLYQKMTGNFLSFDIDYFLFYCLLKRGSCSCCCYWNTRSMKNTSLDYFFSFLNISCFVFLFCFGLVLVCFCFFAGKVTNYRYLFWKILWCAIHVNLRRR